MKLRLLVAHPERQHSHQLAAALSGADMLAYFLHGAQLPPDIQAMIDVGRRSRVAWCQYARRLISYGVPRAWQEAAYQHVLSLYDLQVAHMLPWFSCDAVVGYENSCSKTFEEARKLGMSCVLDAANVHYRSQIAWLPGSNTARSIAAKNREIELSDMIITCSSLARDSYIAAGVPPEKVYSVPLGVDLNLFRADYSPEEPRRRLDDAVIFCNAGLLDIRKGMDLIINACTSLREANYFFEFIIAGNKIVADPNLIMKLEKVARVRGRLPHEKLRSFYTQADVFVLPSRFDSFGMVVLEALACGLPVIVSDNVGAKDIIKEGVNGWIIPTGDGRALTERMAWCAANPRAVRAMSPAARASADAHSWAGYRSNLVRSMVSGLKSEVQSRNGGDEEI